MRGLPSLTRFKNALIDAQKSDFFRRLFLFSLERSVRLSLAFVLGAAIARQLGPHDFGLMAYAIAFVALVSVLCSFGVEAIVLRDLGLKIEKEREMVPSAVLLRLGTGVIGVMLCAGYVVATEPTSSELRGLVMIQSMILLFGWGDVVDSWFQAGSKVWLGVGLRLSACLVGASLRFYLLVNHASTLAFILAGVGEAALMAVVLWMGFLRNRSSIGALIISRGVMADLLRRGWPLAISSVLVTSILQSDRILLGNLASSDQVGWYAASARFLDLSLVFPLLLSMSAQKLFVRETVGRQDARSLLVKKVLGYGLWSSLFVGGALCLTAKWTISLVFGAKYGAASEILAVHAWIVVFVMQVSLRSSILVAEGRQRTVLVLTLLTALVQWLSLPWAISRAGAMGAAYVTLASWICSAWVFPLFFRTTRWFVLVALRSLVFPFKL
ncbi:MAG TPA: oligosaccharide flippase family protein [Opitutaceae bacterium]|nr:oligosaccharide flippase family protein [Opitutaceae bacterium]